MTQSKLSELSKTLKHNSCVDNFPTFSLCVQFLCNFVCKCFSCIRTIKRKMTVVVRQLLLKKTIAAAVHRLTPAAKMTAVVHRSLISFRKRCVFIHCMKSRCVSIVFCMKYLYYNQDSIELVLMVSAEECF